MGSFDAGSIDTAQLSRVVVAAAVALGVPVVFVVVAVVAAAAAAAAAAVGSVVAGHNAADIGSHS